MYKIYLLPMLIHHILIHHIHIHCLFIICYLSYSVLVLEREKHNNTLILYLSADTCKTSRHDISTDWLKIKLFNVGIFCFCFFFITKAI